MKKNLLFFVLAIMIMANPSSSFGAFISPVKSTSNSSAPVSSNPSGVLKNAVADFKTLSRAERKARIKEVKKTIREYKAAKKANAEPSTNTLLLVILAILLPPLAVYLHEGETNNRFWISLVLTLLFWIPGVIYALIVVLGDD